MADHMVPTHNTAYRVTIFNAHHLSIITRFDEKTLLANLGWFATYSEIGAPRWNLVPRRFVEEDTNMNIEEDPWHH